MESTALTMLAKKIVLLGASVKPARVNSTSAKVRGHHPE
jgi:hypothetical protein